VAVSADAAIDEPDPKLTNPPTEPDRDD